MKNFRYIICLLSIIAIFTSIGNKLYADQNFEFYYQVVTGVKDLNTRIDDSDSWWKKAGKYIKKGVNTVKGLWEENITRVYTLKEGDYTWYASRDKNIAYDVKRIKVTSEEQLMELMGVASENEMTEGQKALLATYRAAYSDAIKERSKMAYHDTIKVILTDTTSADLTYKDAKGKERTVPQDDFKHDFWSWSNGTTIHMASHNYNYSGSSDNAASTFLHEYCHSIDKTIREIGSYGKDGSHYGDEMTKKRSAFLEGWAEYNQMIESEKVARESLNGLATVSIELTKKEAKKVELDPSKEHINCEGGWFCNGISTYTYVAAQDLTAEQLWKCEAYNRALLYYIATQVPDGKEKINKAFVDTRWWPLRDISTMIKKLCKNNPDDIAQIGRIIDDLTYGKMTDKEMKKFIGSSKESKAFLKERADGYPNDKKDLSDYGVTSELTGTSNKEGDIFNIK